MKLRYSPAKKIPQKTSDLAVLLHIVVASAAILVASAQFKCLIFCFFKLCDKITRTLYLAANIPPSADPIFAPQ